MRPTEPVTIWGRADSSNVQLVMWGAAELGVPVRRIDAGHRFGGTDTAEYRAMNPYGRVPTMRDGDLVMWESAAILRYLAGRYGDGGALWPADPVRRAPVDMWSEWAKQTGPSLFTYPIFWQSIRTPEAQRDHDRIAADLATWEAALDPLAEALERHHYVAGDAFSLADVAVGHLMYRWFTLNIARQPRPSIEAWYDRLCDRPAYREHVMVSYEALRA
ncbi:glutathione S-transferase family protein [Paracoccus sp. TK19116]|uniref:Glutathione S-transferase family protein n=1 Tax=Paracoccus albicereus TaxID=2922394 RepID=A0ABT1MU68_9RHOB|nr:glutathione S-transferase family protein [Paracoccus albicereus]MCQ0971224.1 glutathione S-transferase family protein [Paracoccus albicereus]